VPHGDRAHVLLVDDDLDALDMVRVALSGTPWRLTLAGGVDEALAVLSRERVDCVLSDVVMPGADGFSLLEMLRREYPTVPLVLHTGYGSLEGAVRAMGGGAAAYLSKPARPGELKTAIEAALARARATVVPMAVDTPRDAVVGRGPAAMALYEAVARAAGTRAPVLLRGETGVGKEWVARAIHRYGARASGPFVVVNCSALAEGTLESELFGHARGSFTGSVGARRGLIPSAHGGTLFLDEIGDASPRLQTELLRVLQEGEVRPVGSDEIVKVDFRVLSATHRDLEARVAEGNFREDLLHRLRTVEIVVPPLRERREDIPELAQHFLAHAPGGAGVTFSPEALAALVTRAWPGNIRELRAAVHRAAAFATGPVIVPSDLPPSPAMQPPHGEDRGIAGLWEKLLAQGVLPLDAIETSYVHAVVAHFGGNKTVAAEALGVDRKTIRRILARHGNDPS
jgi:DNA-binding NtrC family response regulator